MWGRSSWAGFPWAGPAVSTAPIPGESTIPPPIPGATTTFVYNYQPGTGPWAMRSWAGALPLVSNPGGGISIAPNPDTGVMQVWAWWPDAPVVQLLRINVNGDRSPVRGAYGLTVSGGTRRNYATNPSAEVDLSGYVPGTGSPTLTRVARVGASSGSWAWRATVAGAGTNEVTIPHSLPAQSVTVALDLKLSALPTGVTISLGWTNSSGGALTTSSVSLTADQYTASVNQFYRHKVTLTPPAGAANAGSLKVTTTGMPAGGQMEGDLVLAEVGISDGSYVDGSLLGGTWVGTAHLSVSLLAPIQFIQDGECPLDVPVRYEVYNPALSGGRITSAPATLLSANRAWLTHPDATSTPMEVRLTTTPGLVHALPQAVFPILDSPFPFPVSAAQRLAPNGAVEVIATTFAERDEILGMFGTGTPVLLRQPDRFGRGEGEWIVLADITEDALDQKGWGELRLLRAPFQVVESPDPVTV
jgi:hypothetical protein